ncbi:MAG: diaminohydroxyphosphoribosylaminopyrimidine deaminase [Candidatus Midichloriaceae bacterium]|jgi:diaminohydroxyphosphoribosylaminopyrimidine deaminase/5-amino-6-(5-phosphoribosylamino)uracil reductase
MEYLIDRYYMQKAVNAANDALGSTYPNPAVGCVLVLQEKIINISATQKGGRPHAEELAISNTKGNLDDVTLYVTLEPCCITGKKKISCVERIIKAGIKEVVIGVKDPNPLINGNSIELLRNSGIEVRLEILKNKCEELIKGFKKRILENKPYVTLKLATSLDGKIALHNKKSKWITNEEQRSMAHKLRGQSDAILTGIGTVEADDPLLTCRTTSISHTPIRIILDSDLRISENSQILKTSKQFRTIIFTNKEISSRNISNIEIIKVNRDNDGLCLNEVLDKIADMGVNTVLIEGGNTINTSFVKRNLVDEIAIFKSNKIIGNDGISVFDDLNIENLDHCPKFKTKIYTE